MTQAKLTRFDGTYHMNFTYFKGAAKLSPGIFISKCTLWLITLNIYIYKTTLTSHKQYLFCLLFSRNVKTNMQTKVCHIFLVLPLSLSLSLSHTLKRNGSQTFKCSSSNTPFLQCICYWYNLFR